jgi:hypothetical protein
MRVCQLCLGLLVATFAISANAQRAGGVGFSGSRGASFHSHAGAGHAFQGQRRGDFLYGAPLWWDDAYDGSSAPTQMYLTPNQASARPTSLTPPAPSQPPLMIELRGGQYVRVSSTANPSGGDAERMLVASNAGAPLTAPATSALPTVFVFRDGHHEESSDYSIYGGVIYTRTEYWTDGAWTKQIPISALNVAESRKINEDRGVKFTLPGAPNEVVTRP